MTTVPIKTVPMTAPVTEPARRFDPDWACPTQKDRYVTTIKRNI